VGKELAMNKRKLSAVGTGPGDPELITLKGYRRLQAADVVFVPRSKDGSMSLAQRIVDEFISEDQLVVALPLPMTRNPDLLVPAWESAAEVMLQVIVANQAQNAVYLLLGDPMLYGTFTYIWERLVVMAPDLEIDIVPGVTSFAATAAVTKTILSTTDDRLAILPASYETDTAVLQDLLSRFDTIILMKVGPVLSPILESLDSLGLIDKAVYGERVGMPEEVLVTDVRTLMGQTRPYLSLLVVKK